MAQWVRADRTGPRQYVGRNARGAEVRMGPQDVAGAFTPGELLGVALAGCAGMSADHALTRRLGPEAQVTVEVDRRKDSPEDRYTALTERMVLDLSGLSTEELRTLAAVVQRAVDATCTVGLTLSHGAEVTLRLESR